MLLPRRCPLCERPGAAPCRSCAAGLRSAGRLPPVPGLDTVAAVFAYEGAVRALLLALKYRNRRDALDWLGAQLAAAVTTPVDVVTWAPTSRARAGRRGYDQAELLASRAAGALGLPLRPLLRRRAGTPQTGLGAAARRAAPEFTARRRVRGAVLLVDDVTTTGSTLAAAAAALRAAGAVEVHGIVAARTPRSGSPPASGPSTPSALDVAGWGTHAADPSGGPACTSPSAAARR